MYVFVCVCACTCVSLTVCVYSICVCVFVFKPKYVPSSRLQFEFQGEKSSTLDTYLCMYNVIHIIMYLLS